VGNKETIMDTAKVIDKMNEALRHEWTGVAQYAQAGFVVGGLWREVYSEKFHDDAKESFKHAKEIGDKIVALGGVPTVERNPVKQSQDLMELLQNGLEFESKAVRVYTELLGLIEDDRAFTVFIENILEEEQAGVDEYNRILRGQKATSASAPQAGQKAG
jgi:bacterioferritin